MKNLFESLFSKKKRLWYPILSASLIIVYWWGLWNILDFLFLGSDISLHQVGVVISIITVSVLAVVWLDFDLSDF